MPKREKAIQTARCLMEQLTPAPEHALQVCRLSLMLFDQLYDILRLPVFARELLEMAARMHDIGQSVDFANHHKHARDIILKTRFPGLSAKERAIVACIARYHRKKHPAARHRVFKNLGSREQRMVCVLSGILRIADGLDRSQSSCTESVRARVNADSVTVDVLQKRANDVDIWGANRKRALLEEFLQMPIEIKPVSVT